MKLIDKIERFFEGYDFGKKPIELDKSTVIKNPTIFITSHLSILKGPNSRNIKQPYFDRLNKLYEKLK